MCVVVAVCEYVVFGRESERKRSEGVSSGVMRGMYKEKSSSLVLWLM